MPLNIDVNFMIKNSLTFARDRKNLQRIFWMINSNSDVGNNVGFADIPFIAKGTERFDEIYCNRNAIITHVVPN